MKSIKIFFFSGTGNTRKIVYLLSDELNKLGSNVTLQDIEDQNKSKKDVQIDQFDLIGLAYPIYGFGTPKIIDTFITKLPNGAGKHLFLLKTGADYISINHNASFDLIKTLEIKGYSVFYDRIIVMGSNWILAYSDSMVKQLYSTAKIKVENMCPEILQLIRRRYKTGKLMKSLSLGIAYLEKNYGSKIFGKSLKTDANCNLCGLCVKNCPTENIRIDNKSILFGENCVWCMRCTYNCPEKAIYSKGLNFCIIKNGFDLDKILNDGQINSDFITNETRGYYKHFINYINNPSI